MASFRVVLVDPLYEGNIGHAARSMMNFGLTELAIVQGTTITDEGRDRAVHAQRVIDDALRTDTLEDALEGCDIAAGFTARMTGRERRYRRNPADLRDWAATIVDHPGKVALVFGREDRGLTNEDTDRCDQLVCIPTHDMYRSMNLAHAVTVACYTLYAESRDTKVKEYTPARPGQVERIHERFAEVLERSLYPPHRTPATLTMFRRLLGRANPTSYEAETFLGVLRKNIWALGGGQKKRRAELGPVDEDVVREDAELAALDTVLDVEPDDETVAKDGTPHRPGPSGTDAT